MRPSHTPAASAAASIEAVIPVHDVGRPFTRTIDSLVAQCAGLEADGATLRVSVICHNISADEIRGGIHGGLPAGVDLIEFRDGIYSPAGPKNHALQQSTADYLSFVDSDDYLEDGALRAWLAIARATRADAVLAPIRVAGGRPISSARIRLSRPTILDPVRDGLANRSAPLGLLRRSTLQEIGFHYTEGIRTGEDLEPTLRLFFTGSRIAYAHGSPAYCATDDAGSARVTSTVGPLKEELQWLAPLVDQQWLKHAPAAHRRAIGTKLMRTHGIGALRRRGPLASSSAPWDSTTRDAWQAFHQGVQALAGDGLGVLSMRDGVLLEDALVATDPDALARAVQRHQSSTRLGRIATHQPSKILNRDAPARHYTTEIIRRLTALASFPPTFHAKAQ